MNWHSMDPSTPVLQRMTEHIDLWKLHHDNRYLFLSCYARMTGNMIQAIDAGEFQDREWVQALMLRFAEYYFDGLDKCEAGAKDRPRVWEFTHRTTQSCDLHVTQHLLLGINAHINYDLVLTLYELMQPDWSSMPSTMRDSRHGDHTTVNHIIARTIDIVQDEIIEQISPMMDVLDRLMGRVDEYLLSRLIRNWRSDVWNETMELLTLQTPEEIEQFRSRLEDKVIHRANHILLR